MNEPLAANHIAGRTIIITGAASGFGRLLAEKTMARSAPTWPACDINRGRARRPRR